MDEELKLPETEEQKRARSIAQLEGYRAGPESGNKYTRQGGLNSQLPNALKGDIDPITFLKSEKPAHRLMAEMSAQGYSIREIAEYTGYTEHHISNVLRQPAMRAHTLKTIEKTVQDQIKDFLEGEVLPSLKKLVAVRDNEMARPADQLAASNSILDRYLGKPVQPITENQKPPSELTDEQLRQEVERELRQSKSN